MAAYVVSYDLRQPQRDYSRLYERLNDWRALPILESVFVVNGSPYVNAATIRDDLASYVDSNDGLFVAELTGDAAWRSLSCSSPALKEKLTA